MESEKLTVDQRWNQVLNELPAIGKTSRNQQQGFNYRSIDAVLDKVKPLLGKHGIHVIPVTQIYDRTTRTTAKGNQLNVCYITVEWQIRSVDGDFFTAETVGEGTDSGDKATTKAQTMAFKYLLWPSLAVAENEENDADAFTVEASVASQPTTATDTKTTRVKAPKPTGDGTVNLTGLFAIKGRSGEPIVPTEDSDRHIWAGKILARDVASFKDLTQADVDVLKKEAKKQALETPKPAGTYSGEEDAEREF